MKQIIDVESPKGLFKHSLNMSRTYLRYGTYWSVESCLEAIIEKRKIVDETLIKETRVLAKAEDKMYERIVSC
jgi:hypothetical protein